MCTCKEKHKQSLPCNLVLHYRMSAMILLQHHQTHHCPHCGTVPLPPLFAVVVGLGDAVVTKVVPAAVVAAGLVVVVAGEPV